MNIKVLSSHHSESTMYLVGSFRTVEDSIGKQLVEAGLAEEVTETDAEVKEKVEVKPISKAKIDIISKEKINK